MTNHTNHRSMLVAKIDNEYTMEEHIKEIDQRTTLSEIVEWVKSRDDHLGDDLSGRWRHARVYLLDNDDTLSFTEREHVLTIYAVRGRRGGAHYEIIVERFINLPGVKRP
jgi:hypothetical protein